MIRFPSQIGVSSAGAGAKRRTAGRVALAMPIAFGPCARGYVEIDAHAPQGGAQAP